MTPDGALPVIVGPTASGKTSVGIFLARLLEGEIVSVDSRKIYRGLPVGTATPAGHWEDGRYIVDGIPHYFISQLEPTEPYTAGDFARDAAERIRDILARGKTPILVGGTGFYFKSLPEGLPPLPARDAALREALEARFRAEGPDALHRELAGRDPAAAAAIAPNDWHKTVRALEVIALTGARFSDWKDARRAAPFVFRVMGLDCPKTFLDRRIEERSRFMAENGMLEETAALLAAGVPRTAPALDSFGYREAVQVAEGTLSPDAFLAALIKGTKAYAKRQRTWLRTQMKPAWFRYDEQTRSEDISLTMRAFLEKPLS